MLLGLAIEIAVCKARLRGLKNRSPKGDLVSTAICQGSLNGYGVAPFAAIPSLASTAFIAAMATSSIESSGSRVVNR